MSSPIVGYAMKMSSNPAATNTSASPTLASDRPEAPAAQLQPADLGALVRLGVRAQAHAGLAGARGHPGDVPLEDVEIDERRPEWGRR